MYVHAKSVESVAALMTLVVTISLVGTTHVFMLENIGLHIDNFSFFSLCESHSSIIRGKLCMWTGFVLMIE